jgi:hypothetical protein
VREVKKEEGRKSERTLGDRGPVLFGRVAPNGATRSLAGVSSLVRLRRVLQESIMRLGSWLAGLLLEFALVLSPLVD